MGKYIHRFQTKEEHDNARENNYEEPWVSSYPVGHEYIVDYNKRKNYFAIEATQNETTVCFCQSQLGANEGQPALTVQVSTDDGASWTNKTASTAINDGPMGTVIATLNKGDKVLIKGNNAAYGFFETVEGYYEYVNNCNFYADKPCYAYGNMMSLIGGDSFETLDSVGKGAFASFFADYQYSWYPWVLSKEDEPLLLPATTLANSCYYQMFNGCTGLTVAPELPATTLATWCYNSMFYGCTGLTSAPELPATTLANSCYSSMFRGCTNLSYIKAMFTTTPGSSYTGFWVNGVAANGTFVKNSEATWDETGDNGVPTGWTVETAS